MPGFSKNSQKFLTSVGGDHKKILTQIPPSADRITPGEVLIFRYYMPPTAKKTSSHEQRVVLIVRCRRGDGIYPGKTDKLVSCFKLKGDSDAVVDAILENLYKKRRVASYYGKIQKSLTALLGVDSYRTYRLGGMREIYKVSIGK